MQATGTGRRRVCALLPASGRSQVAVAAAVAVAVAVAVAQVAGRGRKLLSGPLN